MSQKPSGNCVNCAAKGVGVFLFATLVMSSSEIAFGQNSDKTVKQTQPETGSRISQTIASSQQLPLNKKWSQLSEQERAVIRSNYEDMPASDEPPYPLDGMAPIFRQISIDAGRLGIYGTFRINVTVDTRGDGTRVTLVEYPSVAAAKDVAYILVKAKYKPAVCHGKPCVMEFPFSIHLVP